MIGVSRKEAGVGQLQGRRGAKAKSWRPLVTLAWLRDEEVMERNSRGDVDFHCGLLIQVGQR